MQQTSPAGPSPVLFFDTVNGYQRSAALKGAVDLDLFTAIAEGDESVAALARRCGAAERGVRILCDYLVIAGFLTKRDGRYVLTADSATFLDRRSPAYLGGSLEFLLSPTILEGFRDVAAIARKGGTVLPEGGTMAPEHPVWVKFARAMMPVMAGPAEALAALVDREANRPIKVLDVAAGHGVFGIAFARRNRDARVAALDWPNVLEVAKENARAAGVADRFSTVGGSAFDADPGRDYDVILLPNFLHHFDPPTCQRLLRRLRGALKPGGRAATLEFVPDEDRVNPPMAASFALMMLSNTAAGDAYTFRELESMFRHAGFGRSEMHELPNTVQRTVISHT